MAFEKLKKLGTNNSVGKKFRGIASDSAKAGAKHLANAFTTKALTNSGENNDEFDQIHDSTTQGIKDTKDKITNNPISNKLKQKATDKVKNEVFKKMGLKQKNVATDTAKKVAKKAEKKGAELVRDAIKKIAKATVQAGKAIYNALKELLMAVLAFLKAFIASIIAFIAANILIVVAVLIVTLLIVSIFLLLRSSAYAKRADNQHYSGFTVVNNATLRDANDLWAGLYYEKYARESIYGYTSLPESGLVDPYSGLELNTLLQRNGYNIRTDDFEQLFQPGTDYDGIFEIKDIDGIESQLMLNSGFIAILDQKMNGSGVTVMDHYAYPAQFIRPVYATCTRDYLEKGDAEAFGGYVRTTYVEDVIEENNDSSTELGNLNAGDLSQYSDLKDVEYLANTLKVLDSTTHARIKELQADPWYIKERTREYLEHEQSGVRDTVAYVNSNAYLGAYKVEKNNGDSSKGQFVIANKIYGFTPSYVPSGMVTIDAKYDRDENGKKVMPEAYNAYLQMYNDAVNGTTNGAEKLNEENMKICSAFRPGNSGVWDRYVNEKINAGMSREEAEAEVNKDTAKDGHSDHQTGYVIDLRYCGTPSEGVDGNGGQYQWVLNHAHEYGFIVRYLGKNSKYTQYSQEDWHLKWIGVEAATEIYNSGISYDEWYTFNYEKEPLVPAENASSQSDKKHIVNSIYEVGTAGKEPLNGCKLLTNLEEAYSTAYTNIAENGKTLDYYYKMGKNDLMESQADYGLGSIVHYQTFYVPSRVTDYALKTVTYMDPKWNGSGNLMKRNVPWSSLSSSEKQDLLDKYGPRGKGFFINRTNGEVSIGGKRNTGLYEVAKTFTWKNYNAALEAIDAVDADGNKTRNTELYNYGKNGLYWADYKNGKFGEPGVSTGVPQTEVVFAIDYAVTPWGEVNIGTRQEWTHMGEATHTETFYSIHDFDIEVGLDENAAGAGGEGEGSDYVTLKQIHMNIKSFEDYIYLNLKNAINGAEKYYVLGSKTYKGLETKVEKKETVWKPLWVSITEQWNEQEEVPVYNDLGVRVGTTIQNVCKCNLVYYDPDVDREIYQYDVACSTKESLEAGKVVTDWVLDWNWDIDMYMKRSGQALERMTNFREEYARLLGGKESFGENEAAARAREQEIIDRYSDLFTATLSFVAKGSARAEGQLQTYIVYHDETMISSNSDNAVEYLENYLSNYETYIPTSANSLISSGSADEGWSCISVDKYLSGMSDETMSSLGISESSNKIYTKKPDGGLISGPKDCDEFYAVDGSGYIAVAKGLSDSSVTRRQWLEEDFELRDSSSINKNDEYKISQSKINELERKSSEEASLHNTIDTAPDVMMLQDAPNAHVNLISLITNSDLLYNEEDEDIEIIKDDILQIIGNANDSVKSDLYAYFKYFKAYGQAYGVDPNILLIASTKNHGNSGEQSDIMHSLSKGDSFKAYNYLYANTTVYSQEGASTFIDYLEDAHFYNDIDVYDFDVTSKSIDNTGWETYVVSEDTHDHHKPLAQKSIHAGAMSMQQELWHFKGNPFMAIISYIIDDQAMVDKVVEYYAKISYKTVEDVMDDFQDIGWIRYFKYAGGASDDQVDEILNVLSYINTDLYALVDTEAESGKIEYNVRKDFLFRATKDNSIVYDASIKNTSGKDTSKSSLVSNAWDNIIKTRKSSTLQTNGLSFVDPSGGDNAYIETAWGLITMGRESLTRGEIVNLNGIMDVYKSNPSVATLLTRDFDRDTLDSIIKTAYAFNADSYYNDLDIHTKEFWQENLNYTIGSGASGQYMSGIKVKDLFGDYVELNYPISDVSDYENIHHYGTNGKDDYRNIFTDWEMVALKDVDVMALHDAKVITVANEDNYSNRDSKYVVLEIDVSAGEKYDNMYVYYYGLDEVYVNVDDVIKIDEHAHSIPIGKLNKNNHLRVELYLDNQSEDLEGLIIKSRAELEEYYRLLEYYSNSLVESGGLYGTLNPDAKEYYDQINFADLPLSNGLVGELIPGQIFNNDFITYEYGGHSGSDISNVGNGQQYFSPVDGKIIYSSDNNGGGFLGSSAGPRWGMGLGNVVVIACNMPDGESYMILIAHLEDGSVPPTGFVKKGDPIGKADHTGSSTGVHAHVEVARIVHGTGDVGDLTAVRGSSKIYNNACVLNGGNGSCMVRPAWFWATGTWKGDTGN